MPKVLENYKLKLAVEREKNCNEDRLSSHTSAFQTPKLGAQSPIPFSQHCEQQSATSTLADHFSITSPSLKSPLSPSNLTSGAHRVNPNNLFQEIMQDRLNEIDQRMAREIASSKKVAKTKIMKVKSFY